VLSRESDGGVAEEGEEAETERLNLIEKMDRTLAHCYKGDVRMLQYKALPPVFTGGQGRNVVDWTPCLADEPVVRRQVLRRARQLKVSNARLEAPAVPDTGGVTTQGKGKDAEKGWPEEGKAVGDLRKRGKRRRQSSSPCLLRWTGHWHTADRADALTLKGKSLEAALELNKGWEALEGAPLWQRSPRCGCGCSFKR